MLNYIAAEVANYAGIIFSIMYAIIILMLHILLKLIIRETSKYADFQKVIENRLIYCTLSEQSVHY